MENIVVLMSLYNGSSYLKEQIDSIINQKDVNVKLIIRNDGSSDNSVEIINEYMKTNNNIVLINDNNIGLARSFMNLVYYAKLDYDYYCFANQDDVWMDNKLISGINLIKNKNNPTLYASNQTLVDENLKLIDIRYKKDPDVSYKQIISNNLIAGCTFVWNKQLQSLLIDENRKPSDELLKKRIHDVWVASVASTCGEIVYDKNSYINYRQHSNNVVGVRKNSKIKTFIKKFNNPDLRCGRSLIAYELFNKFNDVLINDEIKHELDMLGNYKTNKAYKKELLKKIQYREYNSESKFEYKFKIKHKFF